MLEITVRERNDVIHPSLLHTFEPCAIPPQDADKLRQFIALSGDAGSILRKHYTVLALGIGEFTIPSGSGNFFHF